MVVFLFLLVIVGTAGSNVIYKLTGNAEKEGRFSNNQFYALYLGIGALTYSIPMLLYGEWPSATTLICGITAGIGLSLAALCYGKALQSGPYIVSAAMFNYSSFLVIVYSALFLHETISRLRIVGLVILMVLVYLLVSCTQKQHEKKKANFTWLIYILCTLLLNSIVRFILRYQSIQMLGEDNGMMFVYFCTASLTSLLFCRKDRISWPIRKVNLCAALPLALLMALAVCVSTWGQMKLPQLGVDASIQYPIQCSGAIFAGLLAGRILFKEKLKKSLYWLLSLSVIVIFFIYQF